MTVKSKKAKQKPSESPLSETLIPKLKEGSRQNCIDDVRAMAIANPESVISRNHYRVNGKYAESVWGQYFGTWHEFKRQSGIVLSRQQHQLERHIAKHASVDHYREFNEERFDYGDRYTHKGEAGRFKTIIAASDLHDKEVDPFYMRVLIDAAKRVNPSVISLVGDIFDLPEFGKYTVDPREWDVAGRVRFVHRKILKPLREASPDAQIDLIEGNHEARLLRHLCDATPAMKVLLADLHGWTIGKLLGLDEFEINYVAQADLAAFNARDLKAELAKNYRIYYETVLAHHFPEGRALGLPGINGHHHRHVVWSEFNPVYGAYEWHQMGAGHVRSASYCNGQKWHNGFAIINVDTFTRAVNFDYVPVSDFAVVGGKWYFRNSDELVASAEPLLR